MCVLLGEDARQGEISLDQDGRTKKRRAVIKIYLSAKIFPCRPPHPPVHTGEWSGCLG